MTMCRLVVLALSDCQGRVHAIKSSALFTCAKYSGERRISRTAAATG
jgi:hypothetical protein